MRKLTATTMVSLDGVMQAPGGPDEDPTGGFSFGGWSFKYWDEAMGRNMNGLDAKDRELVLGRRTYEIFEAYWPCQPADSEIARALNSVRKRVASRTLKDVQWSNSTLLRGDVVLAVAGLKAQPGLDLGRGKRLFEAGAKPGALRPSLVDRTSGHANHATLVTHAIARAALA